jgi:hypothetical protein
MVSLWQFWRAYLTTWSLPEESIFMKMAVRPGWKRRHLFTIWGRSIDFIYPLTREAVFVPRGHLE